MTTQKSVEAQLESLSDQLDKILEKQNKEQVFAEQANNQFEKNIKAFEKFLPEIAEKYISYQPNEKFDLFLNENGSANIVDYNTSLPMYSEAPIEQVAKQVKKNIDHPIIGRVDHSNVVKIDNPASFIHIELMKSIGEVYNTAKEQLDDNFKVDSSVPSIMIFGVGLGYHLEEILSYTKSGFVSIFEPNEDYFFASLFVCPWYSILELIDNNDSFLYLGIGLDESEIYEQVYTRSKEVGSLSVCHTWFYQHYPSLEVNKLIAEFKKNYHQFFAGFGFFDDALLGIAHTLGNIENSVPLLKNHGVIDENLHKLPAVVVANGPSLDSEIEFLQAVQNDVVIFSCNSASTALCKNAITPDFHVALERTESTYQFLSEHLPENVRANLNLLIPNVMHPKVAGLFKWAGMGLKPAEAGTQLLQLAQYKRDGEFSKTISFCNPLVGNTALSFVTHLGFSEVYLVGVDNGYIDQEHHHSKDSFYYDEKGNTKVTPYKLGKEFRVAGNFCDEVITDEFMNVGNTQMSRLLAHYRKQGGYCYNLSNGAKINNFFIPPH
ncbi:MAG: DUF115 domain-containing protein [Pseudoalteromonas sp.]|uniref:motility associated factor glycosyltransferase family protein n=1 Tax=Pseudoalteromonas sp. TaxID=53249 RepID=UPI0025FE3B24|nr:6-hydroxymethylpterin diphosphokinase MptE-like protein [Pseudoalteromonas sp.]MCH2089543.1 DUF115 domain-containing protein [Pseudoalteromonas sp.]